MKLNVILIIAAIYWIGNGLLNLLAPLEWAGVAINASTPMFLVMAVRSWGVASLALGVIAWLIRNAEPSKTRDAVVLGFTVFFVIQAPVSLYAYFVNPGSPQHIIFAVVEALIAVGFIIVGRSSMSKSAS